MNLHKGSFPNYVDKILVFFDYLPPCVDIFYGMNVDKSGHFKTTYLPHLVNVVCERPLTKNCSDLSLFEQIVLVFLTVGENNFGNKIPLLFALSLCDYFLHHCFHITLLFLFFCASQNFKASK